MSKLPLKLPGSWEISSLNDIADFAPSAQTDGLPDDYLAHFIPMAAVAEDFCGINTDQLRTLGEIRRGYTAFAEGDVLLAKITPCMENGKGGLVPKLPNKVAFGSTEFHVLRASSAVTGSWLAHYLSQPAFRKRARANMTGTAGQMRVPTKWLRTVEIPVPPAAEQTRIVTKLEELLSDLDAGVAELKAAQKKLARYRQSLLKAAVEGALTAEWRRQRYAPPLPNPSDGTTKQPTRPAKDACLVSAYPARGEGLATSASRVDACDATAPLPTRGGGAGGEGAHHPQATTATQQRHARALRREQTPQEHALWQHLRAKRFCGFKFRRQQPLGRYIADFVCFEKRLIVELDGGQHADQQDYDAARDAWLREHGFRVLRFWNNAWQTERDAVLDAVWRALNEAPPLPNPSPARGEGLTSLPRAEATDTNAPLPPRGGGVGGEGESRSGEGATDNKETETGAQLLARILAERRARWEVKQLAKFKEQGKPPPRDWQKKYPEPVQPDTTGLPELPEGWVWASAEMLFTWGSGDFLPASAQIDGNYYVYGGNGINGSHNAANVDHATIVIGRVGVHCGNVFYTESSAWITDNAIYATSKLDLISWPYSALAMKTANLGASSKGGAQPFISQKILNDTLIALPPIQEQEETVEEYSLALAGLEEMSASITTSLKQSTAQRQNLLRAAVSGQLVPQDPNDEPASALLARIRATRDNLTVKPSRKHRAPAQVTESKPC